MPFHVAHAKYVGGGGVAEAIAPLLNAKVEIRASTEKRAIVLAIDIGLPL
jgi:hypothetical protein